MIDPLFKVDGVVFDRADLARIYSTLVALKAANAITNLTVKPRYKIIKNGEVIETFVPDFVFVERRCRPKKIRIIHLVSKPSEADLLRYKLIRAQYRIEVETTLEG